MYQVVLHLLVDGVNTAGQRLGKAAAPYDSIEIKSYSRLGETLHDEVLAVFILVADVLEGGKLAHMMMRAGHPYRLFIFINCNLSRRRTGIYNKYSHILQ